MPEPHCVLINGIKLSMEELQQRVERLNQPLPQKAEPLGRPLKLIGYWAPLARFRGFGTRDSGEPPWPDVRRAVRVGWRADERERLLEYLRNGHRARSFRGYSTCRFECSSAYRLLGSAEFTDGQWLWPEGLPHYVQRHAVMLPDEFMASAAAHQWKVPPWDEVRDDFNGTINHSFWLDWANKLPECPEAPPPGDSIPLERFSLIAQDPEIEELHETISCFFENVWDKTLTQYGRDIGGFNAERFIEWISIKDRDEVVSIVLDGLSRYGLQAQVRVRCSRPDVNDWQRDCDMPISPQ
jgi:hypothetical protein